MIEVYRITLLQFGIWHRSFKLCADFQTLLQHCILTVFNIFAITASSLRCLHLRDVAELEIDLIFFLGNESSNNTRGEVK